jgi:hypothetical protein
LPDKPELLDSAKYSYTIAECRHAARKMLAEMLDVLSEIAMNPTNKNADRIAAAREVKDFALESEDDEMTVTPKLSPRVARLIAKMGTKHEQSRSRDESKETALAATGRVVPTGAPGKRAGDIQAGEREVGAGRPVGHRERGVQQTHDHDGSGD